MKKQRLKVAISAGLISLGMVGSADAALVGRLAATPGGTDYQAYYDDVLDITWAADANINDVDTWQNQNAWAAGLDIGGVTGWRLPTTLQPDASCSNQQSGITSFGFNCSGSELGNLFYNTLGNTANSVTSTGPFSNVQSTGYWSATQFATFTNSAWVFDMSNGNQVAIDKDFTFYAWAVHSGDVSAVPVPAAVWLFGSGLLGLAGFARRKV